MLYDLKQFVHTFTWHCSHPVFGSDKTLFKIKTFRRLDTTFRSVICISTHMDWFRLRCPCTFSPKIISEKS
jgi:hypothetical protein